jgi:hypothetical protein
LCQRCAAYWVCRCCCPLPVSMRRALPDADRPLVAKPASFSRVASPPQSSFISTPAQGLSALRSPARVFSLFAAPPKASNSASAPNRPLLPPSGFLSLSTAYSTFGSAGLFHPAATSRVCCPGASPSAQPPSLFGKRFLPAVLSEGRCQPNGRLHSQRPATSRLCSARRRVLPRTGLSRPLSRSPLQFSPPPGPPSPL